MLDSIYTKEKNKICMEMHTHLYALKMWPYDVPFYHVKINHGRASGHTTAAIQFCHMYHRSYHIHLFTNDAHAVRTVKNDLEVNITPLTCRDSVSWRRGRLPDIIIFDKSDENMLEQTIKDISTQKPLVIFSLG